MPKLKCRVFDDARHDVWDFQWAHAKLDGNWLEVHPDGRALTSHPTDISDKLTGLEWYDTAAAMGETLYGELYVPDEQTSAVRRCLAHDPEELRFSVFAFPDRDEDASLRLMAETCERVGLDFAPYMLLASVLVAEDRVPDESSPAYVLSLLEQGNDDRFEGVVFKDGNTQRWHKWKPTLTLDAVVTDYVLGQGKYFGTVGSLEVSLEGRVVANVSGMDDDVRESLGEGTIGRVVEVAYQRVGTRGRLRHPRLVRFRDDKRPEECTLDQDPDLSADGLPRSG